MSYLTSEPHTTSSASNVRVTYTTVTAHLRHRGFGWWGILDGLGHKLHLPKRIQKPICDRYEMSLGIAKELLIAMDYDYVAPWWLR